MQQYEWLIDQLDAFIRKYYANKLIRGVLIFLSCLLGYLLTVSVGEYYLYLPVWTKITLVTLFLVSGTLALFFWIIKPLSGMARLGKVISREQAAVIIGEHFPEINDKLLNILQLKYNNEQAASRELVAASIEQKIGSIAPFPFGKAVDFRVNRKYLPFFIPIVLICIIVLLVAPDMFRQASQRLLQPTRTFEKPAPFSFNIVSQPLEVVYNSDYTLRVSVSGSVLPQSVSIVIGEDKIPMESKGDGTFQYTMRNVNSTTKFRLYGGGYYSGMYTLNVLNRPVIKAFKVQLSYPSYTGRKSEQINGIGDLTVPAGTTISWAIATDHADKAWIQFGEERNSAIALPQLPGAFAYQQRFFADTTYKLTFTNSTSKVSEQFHYKVLVIPDQYPVLQVMESRDTTDGKQIFLAGTAGDDYGITKVVFRYQITDAQNNILNNGMKPLNVSGGTVKAFQHYFDVQPLGLLPGQKLSYFIEAWDNDGVNGSKASRSEMMTYRMYDVDQIDSALSENAKQINSGLSNSAGQTRQMQQQMQQLQSKMLQSNEMSWEQKQSLQELNQKQEQLKNNLERIRKRFDEQIEQSKQKEYSDDVKEKQEALKEQIDNVLNKELQEQMKKLQELMQQLNKEQAMDAMQQMQEQNKLFNMDMERIKELMKKLEMQMRMEDLANKMEQLSKEQSDLRQQTDAGKKDNNALAKEQQQLSQKLEKTLKEDFREMKDMNQQMQQQQDLEKQQEQANDAKEQMQQSEQQLGQNQNSKSSQSQSKAAQNLQDMANSLRQQASGMDMEQIEMDIKAVRQLLTNLMRLSFEEEQLLRKVQTTPTGSPAYLANQEEQNQLHSNSLLIRDSLHSLSKRLFKLAPTINKETTELEKNMRLALNSIENRMVGDAAGRQQYVMMHTNNLALMLNEVLSNLLQMQSQSQKNGKQGQCKNPGGSTPKPGAGKQLSDIISKQQGISKAMEQMKSGEQKGSKPGKTGQGGQNGQGGQQSNGEYGDAQQLVQLAQQQAAIRRQLQQLNSLLNSKGMGNAKELKEIQKKMDRNETDLVNRKLDGEFLLRQKEILTRLLETERSLREQEQDDKRTSKDASEISRPLPPELQEFIKQHQQLLEQYKTAPASLKPYYRQMVEQYFKQIGQ